MKTLCQLRQKGKLVEEDDVDKEDVLKFVEVAKRRKLFLLEDAKAKSNRLRDEGTVLYFDHH